MLLLRGIVGVENMATEGVRERRGAAGETDRQTNKQAGRQAGRQTNKQADRQTDRQTSRQTGKGQ